MTVQRISHGLLTLGVAAILAGCGGGTGGGGAPEPAPEPDPAPSPDPAPNPDPAPPPSGDLSISISPQSGTHGTPVTVRASGFEPGAEVGIGLGPPQSEYDIVTEVTADADGTVTGTVNVPNWTEPGRDYLFAAQAPNGADVISSPFRVRAEENGDGDGAVVRLTGELTDEGVECPAFRGDNGQLYTLAGDTGNFSVGDRVVVEGSIAEQSFCMQGTTIELDSIREAG